MGFRRKKKQPKATKTKKSTPTVSKPKKQEVTKEIPLVEEGPRKLSVGQKIVAKMTTGEFHPGEIMSIREKANNTKQYLIHFDGSNRRLDIWLAENEILSDLKSINEVVAPNGMVTTIAPNGRIVINKKDDASSNVPERKMTRLRKRKFDEINHVPQNIEDMDATTAALEKAHEEFTKIKYIEEIEIGYYKIQAWYFSPYPRKYGKSSKLFICEFCLKYMCNESTYLKHMRRCNFRLEDKIYAKGDLQMYEIDGVIQKLYCQNLCLFAKLFLDHKTLYYDVTHFYFYVLMEVDENGPHICGYFSKEKCSGDGYNLSCIMVLPPYQRKGYGKFLISMSYELSKLEGKIGTPEKPLSDLGRLSYRSYWCWVLLEYLKKTKCSPVTLGYLSCITGFQKDDIIYSLQTLGLLKYWKGQYVICGTLRVISEFLKSGNCRPPRIVADPRYLHWTPPIIPKKVTSHRRK